MALYKLSQGPNQGLGPALVTIPEKNTKRLTGLTIAAVTAATVTLPLQAMEP